MKRYINYIIIAILGLAVGFFMHRIFFAAPQEIAVVESESRSDQLELSTEYLRIYTLDEISYKEYVRLYVRPPNYLNVKQRLDYLAGLISQSEFRGLPIEISDIENRDDLDIIRINLKEIGDFKSPSWRYGYFQGSCGGQITSHTLKESFLQRDYKGEWIDGVEFHYEGRPMADGDWDHVCLGGLIMRSLK
jgi:hypothetical protein